MVISTWENERKHYKKFDNKKEKIDRPLKMFFNNKKLLDSFRELKREIDLSK